MRRDPEQIYFVRRCICEAMRQTKDLIARSTSRSSFLNIPLPLPLPLDLIRTTTPLFVSPQFGIRVPGLGFPFRSFQIHGCWIIVLYIVWSWLCFSFGLRFESHGGIRIFLFRKGKRQSTSAPILRLVLDIHLRPLRSWSNSPLLPTPTKN